MDITQELTNARQKLEKTKNLIDEMGAERQEHLKTLDRVQKFMSALESLVIRLEKHRQVFLKEIIRLENEIQELEQKISEN